MQGRCNAVILSLLVSLLAVAGLIATPLAHADKRALVGGTMVDGYVGGPVEDSVILVRGNTIEAVGTREELAVPDGYEEIDMNGMTVMPGLWEMHAHLMLVGHTDYDHWHPTYKDRLGDEIMPAAAEQLLLAGVTTARDLGAPLEESAQIRDRIEDGEIAGPRLFVSGPFIQPEPYPDTEHYRWGVDSPEHAREQVARLAEADMDVVKLVDQDLMSIEEAQAVVDEAHAHDMPVVAHSHRPDEIRVGLEIGVDNFEHTGLTTAPEYPEDIIRELRERTATGRVHGAPLYWTPTLEGLWNYPDIREQPERLENDCWHRGLEEDTIADIEESIQNPERLEYYQLHPERKRTIERKFQQLRESGVILLIGTDSGIPLKFQCDATWNELDVWVRVLDVPAMDALRSATYWPASFMGVEDRWGTLAEGQYADIIAVEGNAVEQIDLLSDVDFVMKDGTIYKRDGEPVEEKFQ